MKYPHWRCKSAGRAGAEGHVGVAVMWSEACGETCREGRGRNEGPSEVPEQAMAVQ